LHWQKKIIKPTFLKIEKCDCLYQKFFFYRKLLKAKLKKGILRWFKSVEEKLQSQAKQFSLAREILIVSSLRLMVSISLNLMMF
jgi:hypothetical protein